MNTFDKFKNITGIDIELFFNSYISFCGSSYSSIVNYYNGQDIDQKSFNDLDDLIEFSNKIKSAFELHQSRFDTADFWELIDKYSNVDSKLLTIVNLSRWLRSSRGSRFSSNINLVYVQKQNESIESISIKTGGGSADWVNLALDNDLNEEAYSNTGGKLLNVKLKNNFNFDIKNVVDNFTSEENLYGKDIQSKIELISSDVVCLSGETSLIQTINNTLNTFKGSIPEFPADGIDHGLVGSNVSVFNYPAQFRNIVNMLQKDDRIKSFEIIDIYRETDKVFMKFQIKTRIGGFIKQELML